MKKLLSLLLFSALTLSALGQGFTNATGKVTKFRSVTLGGYTMDVNWSDFNIPKLPSDAVVQQIIPVIVVQATYDICFQFISYSIPGPPGPGSPYGFFQSTPPITFSVGTGSNPLPGESFSYVEMFDTRYAFTDLSQLPHSAMGYAINSSLLQAPLNDEMDSTSLGFAVYYTSATPTIDSTVAPPPVTVPGGQGVAWSVPETVSAVADAGQGVTGTAVGIPAYNLGPKGLTGTIDYPNANGFNGWLNITLPNSTIKNICTTPWLVVPKYNVTYPIKNGQVVFPATASIVPTDCLFPAYAYNVTVSDVNRNYVYNDNWYLPKNTDFNYDVGQMSHENFGGPITIQIPKGIIQNPVIDQEIDQPVGTALSLNGTIIINGVTFATAAGGVTYSGLVQTNPTISQTVTQPGGTFLNLVGDVRINGATPTTGTVASSFNGRTGAVTPQTGDYSCAQVTGCGGSASYQTFQSNTSGMPQEPAANFSSDFILGDNPGVATNISLGNTGVSANTYTNPILTINAQGRITAASSGGSVPVDFSQADVTGSRSFGSSYTNSSSSGLIASGYGITSGSSVGSITCTVGPSSPTLVVWASEYTATVASAHAGFFCPVPAGYVYSLTVTGAVSGTPGKWVESTF